MTSSFHSQDLRSQFKDMVSSNATRLNSHVPMPGPAPAGPSAAVAPPVHHNHIPQPPNIPTFGATLPNLHQHQAMNNQVPAAVASSPIDGDSVSIFTTMKNNWLYIAAAIVVIVILGGLGYYFYTKWVSSKKNTNTQKQPSSPPESQMPPPSLQPPPAAKQPRRKAAPPPPQPKQQAAPSAPIASTDELSPAEQQDPLFTPLKDIPQTTQLDEESDFPTE